MEEGFIIDALHKNLIVDLYAGIQKLKTKMEIANKPKTVYIVIDKQNPSYIDIHVDIDLS
jgi:hypothetical protein